ncbi:4-alpha-glucanotransferase [Thiohalomonas denitrificans]|uniref:4-alpha-glucanotransferase n=1 Tax=Thiohalomonas denitrificans TaxID=415747 RepID=UPI0026EC048E|nr:4-alpha-glucanotransferase [Thiohalomonas denitrificans]
MTEPVAHSPLQERSAGILLQPTSLPGRWETGDLGPEAFRFVEFLVAAGQRVWQILPIGPTHSDRSPYQALSVHAGNPDLISIEKLVEWGWLDESRLEGFDTKAKQRLIREARDGFQTRGREEDHADFARFLKANADWLIDFGLFRVIKEMQEDKGWTDWPASLRDRDEAVLRELDQSQADELDLIYFEQYIFFRQWWNLKAFANQNRIGIFGDMPIFVAHDSADVWSCRECFLLDDEGHPTVVAGVPPDYFSETGQRWGNPHYDWEWLEANGFEWWVHRMESQLALFDLVRIDHFRGFQASWEVPAHEETAMNGRWVEAPGDQLFTALRERFDPLPVVAEDLGTITPEVLELRDKYALPGMKILQFAFDSGPDNPYLPHNQEVNSVVYTGTHDNDTTVGWFDSLPHETSAQVLDYLGNPAESIPWPLIRCAYVSVAQLAVIPLQDALALGSEHRMNIPGTTADNWQWRFSWDMIPEGLPEKLHHLSYLYGRLP